MATGDYIMNNYPLHYTAEQHKNGNWSFGSTFHNHYDEITKQWIVEFAQKIANKWNQNVLVEFIYLNNSIERLNFEPKEG